MVDSHLQRRRNFTPANQHISEYQPNLMSSNAMDVNEYILKFGEYRTVEPCAVRGVTECILGGGNWRFYCASYDRQDDRRTSLTFRSTDGFYK